MAKCFTQLTLFVLRNELIIDLKVVKYLTLFAFSVYRKRPIKLLLLNYIQFSEHTLMKFSNTFSVQCLGASAGILASLAYADLCQCFAIIQQLAESRKLLSPKWKWLKLISDKSFPTSHIQIEYQIASRGVVGATLLHGQLAWASG